MSIRTILVDDERLARVRMSELLAEHPDVEVVAECSSAVEARPALAKLSPDLLLLDVQMPRMTGLRLAQLLPEEPLPLVVFVTAHDSFALEAFDTRAVDYLLKPVHPERLSRALSRVRDQLAAIREIAVSDPPPAVANPPAGLGPRREISRLMAKSGDRVVFIPAGNIDWIESAGNYAIVSAGGERHIIRETMGTLESELAATDFVRINRSLIVNVRAIVELKSQGQGEYCAYLSDGKRASVTVGLRELERRLRFS